VVPITHIYFDYRNSGRLFRGVIYSIRPAGDAITGSGGFAIGVGRNFDDPLGVSKI
jgi:hypothetical protein